MRGAQAGAPATWPPSMRHGTAPSCARIPSNQSVSFRVGSGTAMRSARKPGGDPAEAMALAQRGGAVARGEPEKIFRGQPGVCFPQGPHFRQHAEIGVARQAVSPEANPGAGLTQLLEREGRMPKIGVTARAVHDVRRVFATQRRKVVRGQLIHVGQDPAMIQGDQPGERLHGTLSFAILHRPSERLHEFKERALPGRETFSFHPATRRDASLKENRLHGRIRDSAE